MLDLCRARGHIRCTPKPEATDLLKPFGVSRKEHHDDAPGLILAEVNLPDSVPSRRILAISLREFQHYSTQVGGNVARAGVYCSDSCIAHAPVDDVELLHRVYDHRLT